MRMADSPVWRSRVQGIRRGLSVVKLAALVLLIEQLIEAVLIGVSLAEHPGLVIACLGALGLPMPGKGEGS